MWAFTPFFEEGESLENAHTGDIFVLASLLPATLVCLRLATNNVNPPSLSICPKIPPFAAGCAFEDFQISFQF